MIVTKRQGVNKLNLRLKCWHLLERNKERKRERERGREGKNFKQLCTSIETLQFIIFSMLLPGISKIAQGRNPASGKTVKPHTLRPNTSTKSRVCSAPCSKKLTLNKSYDFIWSNSNRSGQI